MKFSIQSVFKVGAGNIDEELNYKLEWSLDN